MSGVYCGLELIYMYLSICTLSDSYIGISANMAEMPGARRIDGSCRNFY